MPLHATETFNPKGTLIQHFPQTQYLDYRSVAKTLGIIGQKDVEKAVRAHLKKKSGRILNGRVTRYEYKDGPGSAIYEDGKRVIVRNDGTVKEI